MNRKADPKKDPYSLVQMNEKARMHGLSYGQYVLQCWFGKFPEDAGLVLPLNHEHRMAFMAHQKRK